MRLKKQLKYLFLLLLSTSLYAEEVTKLLPVDDAERDPTFFEFREKMLRAIDQKEPEVFVTMLDQNIWVDHEKRGMKHFLKLWHPESIDTELWHVLGAVLKMGGTFVRSEIGVRFCAPYVYTTFPDSLDPFGYGAVIKERSILKAGSSHSSRTITSLSYDLVKVHDWRSVPDSAGEHLGNWIKVTSLSGQEGYVDKSDVRSPTDYAACFLHTSKNGWKLDSFVSNE